MGTTLAYASAMLRNFSLLVLLVLAACTNLDVEAFDDRGHGTWLPIAGVPEMDYEDIWGTGEFEIYAAGRGGIVRHSEGGWHLEEGLPQATYLRIWGRSSDQVWAGGENIVVARSSGGWVEQELWDGEFQVRDFVVQSVFGSQQDEYLLATVGGRQLLFRNAGSRWQTARVGGSAPLPNAPSAIHTVDGIVVAGQGDAALLSYRDFQWDSIPWRIWASEPNAPSDVAALVTTDRGWIAAGSSLHMQIDSETNLVEVTRAPAASRSAASDLFAEHANKFFVVGKSTTLHRPDPVSQVLTSPIEACDQRECSLEVVLGLPEGTSIQAVWGDDAGHAWAVGRGFILQRSVAHAPD